MHYRCVNNNNNDTSSSEMNTVIMLDIYALLKILNRGWNSHLKKLLAFVLWMLKKQVLYVQLLKDISMKKFPMNRENRDEIALFLYRLLNVWRVVGIRIHFEKKMKKFFIFLIVVERKFPLKWIVATLLVWEVVFMQLIVAITHNTA